MLPGLDSRPPSDAQIAAAKALGYRVWGLYHGVPGDGIDPAHLASDDDFRRVKAAGFSVIAYVSGNDDPAAIKAWSQAMGVRAAVDVERFIRSDGPWVPGFLDASGSGLYGNQGVHPGRSAPFHIQAFYPGYDPGTTWMPGTARPPGPCALQWKGTTDIGIGLPVDLSNFDDWFSQVFGADAAQLMKGGDMALFRYMNSANPADPLNQTIYHIGDFKRPIEGPEFGGYGRVGQGMFTDVEPSVLAKIPDLPGALPGQPIDLSAVKAELDAILASGNGTKAELDSVQATLAHVSAKLDKDLA